MAVSAAGDSANPVLIEVRRGELVESRHRGAVAIADTHGSLLFALGEVSRPVFPRSAIKAFQALPLVESGAAEALNLRDAELAVACASHSGDPVHLEAVRSILAKAEIDEGMLACGAHWPLGERAASDLILARERPRAIHNNCSGKHAGMLAAALQLGLDPGGYERPDHPLQQEIKRILSEICGVDLDRAEMGIDGCSVPTFALPLASLATGFARLGSGAGLGAARAQSARRLVDACFSEPVLMAGEGRFALKIDDGAKRGTETVLAHLLAALVPGAQKVLAAQLNGEISTWRGRKVGELRASDEFAAELSRLASLPSTQRAMLA
jgi:L-asparaginase II